MSNPLIYDPFNKNSLDFIMKFYLPVILFFVFLVYSCSEKNSFSETYKQIKILEYNRQGNIHLWQSIYKDASKKVKNEILLSIGKTKKDSLSSFLYDILSSEKDTGLLKSAVFAIGQLENENAENTLLKFYKNTPALNIQKAVLSALEKCGGLNSVPILVTAIENDSLRAAALQTAAILARKKVDVNVIKNIVSDSAWQYSDLKENAYFMYYSAAPSDLKLIANTLNKSANLTQKYYLRALDKIIHSDIYQPDSSSFRIIQNSLRHIIKNSDFWQNKLYALKTFPAFADSTDESLLKQGTGDALINIKIEALKTFGKVFKKNAVSFLISKLQTEPDYTVKGKIIYTLAEIDPKSAYRLIMQNLDKGTVSFKEDLIKSLALYKDPLALNAVKNFIFVDNERLAALAISVAGERKILKKDDINDLMQSKLLIVVYSALEWQKENNNFVSNDLLLDAFNRFDPEDNKDLQNLILDILDMKKEKPAAVDIKPFAEQTQHNEIIKRINSLYPSLNISTPKQNSNLPVYLGVDSLIALPDKNLEVKIVTSRGEFLVELFTENAPLTVQNFLHLSRTGFYNNLIFHRVIADFVVQGGDPSGTGWGGAGYEIPSEDILPFERGTIGMATSGFDTGSSQFFICQSEQPHLRGSYSAFGKVVKGIEIVDNLQIDDVILRIETENN